MPGATAGQVAVDAHDGDAPVGDGAWGREIVLRPGRHVVQPQAEELPVREPDVHLVHERGTDVRVREVVPARRGDGSRRSPELSAETLVEEEKEIADLVGAGDLLADGVRLRDERRAVAAGVVHAHGAVATGVRAHVHLQREADLLREVHRQVGVVDAHLRDGIVVAGRVQRAGPRQNDRRGDGRVAVDEIELQPGVRHHAGVRELVRVHGNQRRRVQHQAALPRPGARALVQPELRGEKQIAVEVEDVLARQRRLDAERDRRHRAGRLRLAGIEAEPGDPIGGGAVRHRHRRRGEQNHRPEADSKMTEWGLHRGALSVQKVK